MGLLYAEPHGLSIADASEVGVIVRIEMQRRYESEMHIGPGQTEEEFSNSQRQ
jgi:hypothetical protein